MLTIIWVPPVLWISTPPPGFDPTRLVSQQSMASRGTRTSQLIDRSARYALLAESPPALSLLPRMTDTDVGEVRAETREEVSVDTRLGSAPAARRSWQHTEAFDRFVQRPSPTKPSHTIALTKSSKAKATRSDDVRAVRRGELEGIPIKYGIKNFEEFKELCALLDSGSIKRTEIDELFHRGKIVTSSSQVKRYVYGEPNSKDKATWRIKPKAYLEMTQTEMPQMKLCEPMMLLGLEAEAVMLHIIVRVFRRKKGFTEREISMWARAQVRTRPDRLSLPSPHCAAPHRRSSGSVVRLTENLSGIGCPDSMSAHAACMVLSLRPS